jgi:hypothetical protein
VRTGKSARATLLGTQGFQHLEHDGELAETFNRVTIELTRLDAGQIVRTYDFSAFTTVMDVGGGGGELLSAILRAHPSVSGVLFELPHAIETARSNLQQAAVLERCRLVAGDFLKSIPAVAEGIILKSVLHDWADDRCRTLLSQVRSASRAGGILLVIEQELSESLSMSRSHQAIACSDLSMLVAHSGRERTLDEYRRLLQSAGFEVTRVIPIGPTLRIIESRADG